MKFIEINGSLINLDHIVSISPDGSRDYSKPYAIVLEGEWEGDAPPTWHADFKTEEERTEALKDLQVFIRHPDASILSLC